MINGHMPLKSTHSIQIKELLKFTERTLSVKKGSYIFQEGMNGEECPITYCSIE